MTAYQTNLGTVSEEADLKTNYVEIIQTVIASLEEDQTAMVNQQGESYLWKFNYGSVEVFVQLTGSTDDDVFKVWASILKLPAKNETQLFQKLLTMNWAETLEASFGIVGDQVVIASTRTVADLSPAEISRNITIVATLADTHDDALKAEFGA
jgi:hypothetical protein